MTPQEENRSAKIRIQNQRSVLRGLFEWNGIEDFREWGAGTTMALAMHTGQER